MKRIMYRDQILFDFDRIKVNEIDTTSGAITLEPNTYYSANISSNFNITLPVISSSSYADLVGYVCRIVIYATVSNSPSINLGTTYSYSGISTLANGKYMLTYEYNGSEWVLDIKTQQ